MRVHQLSNGLRVCVEPMPSLETVALGVWAHAGSVNERTSEHGLAHLLEHVAFKGTKTRNARQIAEDIENVGGYLNAATSHQRTGYYARLLREDVALGIEILADILLEPTLASDELAREQEVVIQEIGEAADIPDDVVFELLQEKSWGTHPLARPILGTPTSVRTQTPQTLSAFMDLWYRPENMVVAAAGGVDEDEILSLVEARFGSIAKGAAPSSPEGAVFTGGIAQDIRDSEQAHLALAFPGVAATDDTYFATRLYADVLGGGMSSRLFQKIREERGLAYSVYAFADGYEKCGLTGAYVGADPDQIPQACALIRAEMEAMCADISQNEIDRARALLKSSMLMSLESPANRIEAAAGQLLTYGRFLETKELLERLGAVAIDDVRNAAQFAISGPFAMASVGPSDIGQTAEIFAIQ